MSIPPKLQLYTVFHLNLAYSSIEEAQRAEVVRRCYWPLLKLARSSGVSLGIEASAYTLQTLARLDADWILELRTLISDGSCEFVGSGYAQIIGPLVPAEVNAANLRVGNQVYEKMLGRCPDIALVNEQAYASGLIQLYLDAGYKGIVMEWDNPASQHSEWPDEWRYSPQIACGQYGEQIPVIWNNSIAFQKFQRYAHAELSQKDYLAYLREQGSGGLSCFPLYGNDVEIFDFRPGRYQTEAPLSGKNEWTRIESLFSTLAADDRFEFVLPSGVLKLLDNWRAGNRLELTSPEQPVHVKKQGKYNVTRWAVTGRADLEINTACWQIYSALTKRQDVTDDHWRMLCYFWSSDFRTHITEKRWRKYVGELNRFCKELWPDGQGPAKADISSPVKSSSGKNAACDVRESAITVETSSLRLRLNPRRGLAIDALWFKDISEVHMVGTLAHGYFDDISMGADFYSGHVVFEPLGAPKITDLVAVSAAVQRNDDSVEVSANISTLLGAIRKTVRVPHDEARVELHYDFDWQECPVGILRLGMVTLNPEAFDRNSLYYRTHNGGRLPETFRLTGGTVDHGQAVSSLVSANAALGLTEGAVEVGDAETGLRIAVDKCKASAVGLMTYKELRTNYFLRLALSLQELDETSKPAVPPIAEHPNKQFSIVIEPLGKP